MSEGSISLGPLATVLCRKMVHAACKSKHDAFSGSKHLWIATKSFCSGVANKEDALLRGGSHFALIKCLQVCVSVYLASKDQPTVSVQLGSNRIQVILNECAQHLLDEGSTANHIKHKSPKMKEQPRLVAKGLDLHALRATHEGTITKPVHRSKIVVIMIIMISWKHSEILGTDCPNIHMCLCVRVCQLLFPRKFNLYRAGGQSQVGVSGQ